MRFEELQFGDKCGRQIRMLEEAMGIACYFEGQQVGTLVVESVPLEFVPGRTSEGYRLKSISVATQFQRAGIGMEMLVNAKSWFYPLQVPPTGMPSYLAFLDAAGRKGILMKRWPAEHDQVKRSRR